MQLPLKDSKHKMEIIDKFGCLDESHIKTKVIKGFKSSKWEDKNVMYKIRASQIGTKKTNYLNEYFEAIHLSGLLPVVREKIEIIER